jgi:hypothetical protein
VVDTGIILKGDVKRDESVLSAFVWLRIKSTGRLLK